MPSKQHEPSKPTFYLDHSTLCAAFKAHRLQPDAARHAAYLPVIAWIQRVANEANLCLSTVHIVELGLWKDVETATAMVRWYEGLPIVWMRSMHFGAEDFESEFWTKVAAGVAAPDAQASPFAPSLLAAFHAQGEAARVLRVQREPLLALFNALRESPEWCERWRTTYPSLLIANLARLAQNHEAFRAKGWTEQRERDEMASNVRVELRACARDADIRLTAKGDLAYSMKECPRGTVPTLFVDLYDRNPRAMPLFRIRQRFNAGALRRVERSQSAERGSSKSLRHALHSSFGDWMHLVGAAYCDVFTCDGAVSNWLGDVRSTFELHPQLAVTHGDHGKFVRDLMATWP